jgi:hypothetical protein
MTIAIMQPYLFPYIGYFQLINAVDKFIIYDDVAFINKGWINRNNILSNGKASLFTLPLIGASQNKLINEIEIENLPIWGKKFLKTLEQNYKKAPHYQSVMTIIEKIILSEKTNISDVIYLSLEKICSYLAIKTQLVRTSSIYQNQHLKAQERILDICLQEKATHYINPIGGRELYDKNIFAQNHIQLSFIQSKRSDYQQFKDDFVPWLSIIDGLMFCSINEIKEQLLQFELV